MRNQLRLLSICFLAAVLALVAGVGSARAQDSARSEKLNVGPGESIQAAVNAARPGDSIVVRGAHREDVVIRKNGIKLRGVNAVLRPPARPDSPCSAGPASVGICILGDVNLGTFELTGARVRDVSVSGFTIRGFGDGIVALGARNAAYVRNEGLENEGYGFAAFLSTGTKVLSNSAHDNGFAGIYVGDSANANLKVLGNDTFRNALGMFFRNSSLGSISGNKVHNNCAGMLFLAENPGPDGRYDVKGNTVDNNTRACPGSADGPPPLSGIGIWLSGSRGMEIVGNRISGNVPSADTVFSGGVVVARGFEGQPPSNNSVAANNFGRNRPDIFWDESGSGNRFANNNCDTSEPARLCN
jgi:parallel beta-helix repeat protein